MTKVRVGNARGVERGGGGERGEGGLKFREREGGAEVERVGTGSRANGVTEGAVEGTVGFGNGTREVGGVEGGEFLGFGFLSASSVHCSTRNSRRGEARDGAEKVEGFGRSVLRVKARSSPLPSLCFTSGNGSTCVGRGLLVALKPRGRRRIREVRGESRLPFPHSSVSLSAPPSFGSAANPAERYRKTGSRGEDRGKKGGGGGRVAWKRRRGGFDQLTEFTPVSLVEVMRRRREVLIGNFKRKRD